MVKKIISYTTKLSNQINKSVQNYQSNNPVLWVIFIIVGILIILGCLFAVYVALLNNQRANKLFVSQDHYLMNQNIYVEKSHIPTCTERKYTIGMWFSVDKKQYEQTDLPTYSHLFSYGEIASHLTDSNLPTLNAGVWIDNTDNDLIVIYRTETDSTDIVYDPNSSDFNCETVIRIKKYLLNEWNFITIMGNANAMHVYLNANLLVSNITEELITADPDYISIGYDQNIYGVIKKLKFANFNLTESAIHELYKKGPNQFMLPDWNTYTTSSKSSDTLLDEIEEDTKTVLDYGANIVTTMENGVKGLFNFF